jgi:hypothetical protein
VFEGIFCGGTEKWQAAMIERTVTGRRIDAPTPPLRH